MGDPQQGHFGLDQQMNGQQRPEKPEGEAHTADGQEPPEKPEGNEPPADGDRPPMKGEEPPAKPEGEEDQTPPEKPEDNAQDLLQDRQDMFRLFQQFLEWLKGNVAE